VTTGWKLDCDCREALLKRYPPRYDRVVADHVTLKFKGGKDGSAPPDPVETARIVGRADDDNGVEAMVVSIDGGTDRPDGSTWHITWSLGSGRSAKESNDVIAARGWDDLDGGPVVLQPATWS
jgi:imidazole glycerol phosphate synthase subunit HisF